MEICFLPRRQFIDPARGIQSPKANGHEHRGRLVIGTFSCGELVDEFLNLFRSDNFSLAVCFNERMEIHSFFLRLTVDIFGWRALSSNIDCFINLIELKPTSSKTDWGISSRSSCLGSVFNAPPP